MSEEDDYTFFKELEKRLFESGVCKIGIPDGETDTPVQFLKKFKEMTHVLTQDPFACDAKWTLFVTAANSFNAKVNHDCNSEDTILYETRRATYGTKYAFYSCNPDTMYKLLCKGFKLYKNSMKEIYLTDKIRIALSKIPRMAGWGKSSCGPIFRVVGLCECIMKFEYLKRIIDMKFNCPSVYVEVPELLRLSYLLFYTEHLPKQQKRESIITQIFNKNYSAHITLLLVAILGYICRKRIQLTCAVIRNKIDHIPILRRIFFG
ncbi:uncharacterized protein LOC119667798 [Teleopsis dalmanni]|uniref:uncharacterized protein LOC119667798 n=1 Tax=Teleopsis dalmanni TaxID=139649 RepID=UPI0018CE4F4C|nr:uncharacterized protein LOC119667798 [Teleopsis dalmanni]